MVAKHALLAVSVLSFPQVTNGLPNSLISAIQDGTLSISVPEISTGTKSDAALSEIGDSVLLGVSTLFFLGTSQGDAPSSYTDASSLKDQGAKEKGFSLSDNVRDPGIETEEEPTRANKAGLRRNRERRFQNDVIPLAPEDGDAPATDLQQENEGNQANQDDQGGIADF